MREVLRFGLACLFLLALVSSGAFAWVTRNGIVGTEINSLAEINLKNEFSDFERLLQLVNADTNVMVYEGLPHPVWEDEELRAELRSSRTIRRGSFAFYESEITLSKSDRLRLLEYLVSGENLEAWHGFKECGGFHPDYTTVWKSKVGEVEVQFCFGCREARIFFDGEGVRSDLSELGATRFQNFLTNYSSNCSDTLFLASMIVILLVGGSMFAYLELGRIRNTRSVG